MVEMRRQAQIVADEDEGAAGPFGLAQQQFNEGSLTPGIERRGWFVSDQDFRLADQRSCRGNTLLLADREFRGGSAEQGRFEVERGEQTPGFGPGFA